jgi:hypothetical protein
MLPHGVAEQDNVQVTPLFAESFVTVAVNCAVLPTCTVAVLGAMETVIGGTVLAGTVIVAEADLVGSAAEVAVRITFRSLAGGVVGAV